MATGRVPTTANSPLTAKGDLFGYSTTQARVAVGNDGETLVANSSASTGVSWGGPSTNAGKNGVLNSAFDIWQRGTSFTGVTTNNTYIADRWALGTSGTYNAYASRQATGDTTNLPNIQYCARIGRTNGTTGVNYITLNNSFESSNSIQYAGKTVVLSFYARAGSGFTASGNTLYGYILSGTGTDQSAVTGYTGQAYGGQGNTLTTTWQRFTTTYAVPATATEVGISFQFAPTGTAGANDYCEITGVQLEVGSVATAFARNASTLQGELAACQRYYYRQSANGTNFIMDFGIGSAASTTSFEGSVILPVQMRIPPTSLDSASLQATDLNTNYAITSPTIGTGRTGVNVAHVTGTISGATQYRLYYLGSASSSGYIGLSAEL